MEDLLPENIIDVSFGIDHAIALTGDGNLYSWGSSKWGQVGLGASPQNPLKPTLIKAGLSSKTITSITCGSSHSACLTTSGDVYTWGRGFEGQTGHASSALEESVNDVITSVQLLPKCVSAFVKNPVKVVECGEKFTIVVCEDGSVWSWGEGGSGQLGCGRVTKQAVPKRVMEKCPLTGEVRVLYVYDDASWVNILTRRNFARRSFARLLVQKFVGASAGWGHTIAWTENGEVKSCEERSDELGMGQFRELLRGAE